MSESKSTKVMRIISYMLFALAIGAGVIGIMSGDSDSAKKSPSSSSKPMF